MTAIKSCWLSTIGYRGCPEYIQVRNTYKLFVAQTDADNAENVAKENLKECITAVVVPTEDGPTIKVHGIKKDSLTATQLEKVQQRIREELKKGNCDGLLTHESFDQSPIKYLF